MMKKLVIYVTAATAIAVAIWGIIGSPLPTYPDGGLAQNIIRR
jgi:hypothetical protein